jgi:hypothetical protein
LFVNSLNVEINTIFHLLALIGAHHILHVSSLRVKPHAIGTISQQAALDPWLAADAHGNKIPHAMKGYAAWR